MVMARSDRVTVDVTKDVEIELSDFQDMHNEPENTMLAARTALEPT